jgi:hypothetical protein
MGIVYWEKPTLGTEEVGQAISELSRELSTNEICRIWTEKFAFDGK